MEGKMGQGAASTAYRRILVKLSGEALMGEGEWGIDPLVLARVASAVGEVRAAGVEVAW